jgi:hypothetical protein
MTTGYDAPLTDSSPAGPRIRESEVPFRSPGATEQETRSPYLRDSSPLIPVPQHLSPENVEAS